MTQSLARSSGGRFGWRRALLAGRPLGRMRHRFDVGQVHRKDETFVEEPADKLYNEGLYLMNQRKETKAASKKFEEVDRQHPYSD